MQLLGRVTAVGVHLDEHRVLPTQTPGESGQVRRAQAVLGGAVHDVGAIGIGRRQFVGELAGAVGAAVVDDEQVHVGARVLQSLVDQPAGSPARCRWG